MAPEGAEAVVAAAAVRLPAAVPVVGEGGGLADALVARADVVRVGAVEECHGGAALVDHAAALQALRQVAPSGRAQALPLVRVLVAVVGGVGRRAANNPIHLHVAVLLAPLADLDGRAALPARDSRGVDRRAIEALVVLARAAVPASAGAVERGPARGPDLAAEELLARGIGAGVGARLDRDVVELGVAVGLRSVHGDAHLHVPGEAIEHLGQGIGGEGRRHQLAVVGLVAEVEVQEVGGGTDHLEVRRVRELGVHPPDHVGAGDVAALRPGVALQREVLVGAVHVAELQGEAAEDQLLLALHARVQGEAGPGVDLPLREGGEALEVPLAHEHRLGVHTLEGRDAERAGQGVVAVGPVHAHCAVALEHIDVRDVLRLRPEVEGGAVQNVLVLHLHRDEVGQCRPSVDAVVSQERGDLEGGGARLVRGEGNLELGGAGAAVDAGILDALVHADHDLRLPAPAAGHAPSLVGVVGGRVLLVLEPERARVGQHHRAADDHLVRLVLVQAGIGLVHAEHGIELVRREVQLGDGDLLDHLVPALVPEEDLI
mmetsp:Transcript_35319/g.80203  ORF Transcript_35319/g.80203 Transcript_35319/m.80203 type:complete len:546 (-) Transcript_35319:329-1966(-)